MAPGWRKVASLLFSLFLPSFRLPCLHWSFLFFFLLIPRKGELLKSFPPQKLNRTETLSNTSESESRLLFNMPFICPYKQGITTNRGGELKLKFVKLQFPAGVGASEGEQLQEDEQRRTDEAERHRASADGRESAAPSF